MIKPPQNSPSYYWTQHVYEKMKQYQISEQMIKRVIRAPTRVEEGIAPGTVACMQPRGRKQRHEVWVMYQIVKSKVKRQKVKVKVITTWRYPGISPQRGQIPIPQEILDKLEDLV